MQTEHYNDEYFAFQKKCGILGSESCLYKFEKYINPDDIVLEFGCGGGYFLNKIKARKKIGIEINPVAVKNAQVLGLRVYTSIDEVKDSSIDVIYSHHVLEHLPNPYEALTKLRNKLKNNGKMVFIVPYDAHFIHWQANDRNMHLYTWNSMTAGNLFSSAGYKVIKVRYLRYQWPPGASYIRKFFGIRCLNFLSKLYALLFGYREVQIIAEK